MNTPLLLFARLHGEARLREVWEEHGLRPGLEFVRDVRNFMSFRSVERMMKALSDASGTPDFLRRAGLLTATPEAIGFAFHALRAFGSPAQAYRKMIEVGASFNRVGNFTIEQLTRTSMTLRYVSRVEEWGPNVCDLRKGQFASIPSIWGLPPAALVETECQPRGGASCCYELTWQDIAPLWTRHAAWLSGLAGGAVGALTLDHWIGTWGAIATALSGQFAGLWLDDRRLVKERDRQLRSHEESFVSSLRDLGGRNDELLEAKRALEQINRDLEQRVVQRTAELSTARDELQVALERAHELDRMKSQFFDNISHELRTPLSLVLLSLEYTLQQELSAPVRSYLEGMDRAADRLLRLINRLLDLARLEAGKTRLNYEAVDLRGLIEGMLPPFQVLAGSKGLQLQVETEGDVRSSVIVDLQMIEGIFQNLLGNALKFTSQGSVRVRLSELPDLAVVEVVDTGAGIPAQDLPLIFDRFAQSDSSGVRRFEGSGLGLALVREGVELHGGRVTVQSELGKGSVFRVEIPKGRSHIREELAVRGISPVRTRRRNDPYQQLTHAGFADLGKVSPAPVGELPAIPNPGGASDVPRHQVLVVEDDPELRRFLVAILRQKYRVTEAVNGAEGLQRMRSLRPEVVVSDVMMPEMSGLQMIQAARTEPALADIPVLLLTARREVDSTLNGLEVGANDYLGKPFSPPELIARIEVQLRLREAASRLAASERLAGLGILTSGFAHEVRNPLNGLLNALQPLYEMSLEGEVGDPMLLKLAMDCGTRIQDLSNSLLSLARPALELDQVRVETLLDSTIDVLRWKMPRGIEVERHYDFDGEVPGEPGPLGQVWMNLIDNALRSMGERGRLRLSTALCGEELRVRIEDDGPGIAAGDLQRLFEPFFTTRPAGEGTGLGLALCRRIVERHHGHIEVESSPGHGARFDVYLPLRMHVGADGNWQEPVRGALAS